MVAMNFSVLPPEVNSALIFAGSGSGPMLAAATAWSGLADELGSAAASFSSVTSGLAGSAWQGPASAAMAAAAAPYVSWTRTAATQAEQTASQAQAAAVAYEAAFAETVPPPVIAANRALLMALVSANLLGQNTPAIEAAEAQYAAMWAQDVSAMQGYAGASAGATALTPFASPSSNTDADGQAAQSAAVSQAGGTAAGTAQSALTNAQQAFAAVPTTLSNLASQAAASPAAALSPLDILDLLADLSGIFVDPELSAAGLGVDSTALPYDVIGTYTGFHTDDIVSGWAGLQTWPGNAAIPPTPFPVITNLGSPVEAGVGEAAQIGRLSVPAAWTAAAPEIRLSTMALPVTSVAAAAEAGAGGAGSVFSQMALAGMAGRALAGPVGAGGTGARERVGVGGGRKPAKPGDPATASAAELPAGGPITSIAAELRELASLRDSGILTQEEFVEQKRRLLAH
jgi:PPE-repeat protein